MPEELFVARDLSCQYLRNFVTGSYDMIFPTAVDPIPIVCVISPSTDTLIVLDAAPTRRIPYTPLALDAVSKLVVPLIFGFFNIPIRAN